MSIRFCLIFILLFVYPFTIDATCSLSKAALREARLAAARDFITKTNVNATNSVDIIEYYMTPDAVQIIQTVGAFGPPVLIVEEYQLILHQEPPSIKLNSSGIIDGSEVWIDDDNLFFAYRDAFKQDFYGTRQGLTVGGYNLVNYEVLTFVSDPCLPIKIKRDYITPDPYAYGVQNQAGIAQTQGPESLDFLCGLIQTACPVGTPLQQYATKDQCVNFLLTIPRNTEQTFCPYGFGGSNSTMCRLLHLSLAFIDGATHCPHLGPDSMPCTDNCIEVCSSCVIPASSSPTGYPIADPTTNAYCGTSINYTNVENIQTFECKCRDSTISRDDISPIADRKYCQPITCTADYQCPVKYGTATCVEGKCVPRGGFVWDSSMKSYVQKNMAKCPYGDNRVFWKDGLPFCVKPGYCLQQPDPSTRWQCASNNGGSNDYNTVKCLPLDTDDFGIPQYVKDLLGPRPYGCLCNYGFLGGYEYPCYCPVGKNVQWLNGDKVCLSPGECTQNNQCPTSSSGSKHCVFTAGNPIGQCQA